MLRNWLALIGLVLILAAVIIGLATAQYWLAGTPVPVAEEPGMWGFLRSIVGFSPDQALVVSLVGLLLGAMFTIPWWRERLRQEEIWWQRSDGPVKGPPKAGV